MPEANGSGWVRFAVIHPQVRETIKDYCAKYPRNHITELDDGTVIWRRDPDHLGRGVARNSQVPDFLRVVANAVFKFAVSTVTKPDERAWDWNFRRSVATLVDIREHGWQPTSCETEEDIKNVLLHLDLSIAADGSVSGTAVLV